MLAPRRLRCQSMHRSCHLSTLATLVEVGAIGVDYSREQVGVGHEVEACVLCWRIPASCLVEVERRLLNEGVDVGASNRARGRDHHLQEPLARLDRDGIAAGSLVHFLLLIEAGLKEVQVGLNRRRECFVVCHVMNVSG